MGDWGDGEIGHGCMDAWMHDCMIAWLFGCLVV
jgi:hypothetical protein